MDEVVPIPGFPLYGAKADGTIWSCASRGRSTEVKPWVQKKTRKNKSNGYWYVSLAVDKMPKHVQVHRLIALTFKGPRPEGQQINHKNGVKEDNSDSNLEYLTRRENLEHAWENNLVVIGKPKLTLDKADEIRRLYSTTNLTQVEIGKLFGVRGAIISRVILNQLWTRKAA